jgi:hypothetical protein
MCLVSDELQCDIVESTDNGFHGPGVLERKSAVGLTGDYRAERLRSGLAEVHFLD